MFVVVDSALLEQLKNDSDSFTKKYSNLNQTIQLILESIENTSPATNGEKPCAQVGINHITTVG